MKNIVQVLQQGSMAIPRLLLTSYVKLGLTEEQLMMIIHINYFLEQGKSFPTPEEIAAQMSCTYDRCTEILRTLIQKGFLTIDVDSSGPVLKETFTLQPLWEKLLITLDNQSEKQKQELQQKEEVSLYTVFEKEFGRPLSPFEGESLSMWIDQDHHDPTIIKAALKEAVISGKLNFRYIDRILFEWKKNGVQTIEQARDYSSRFRDHQKTKPMEAGSLNHDAKPSIPIYNWLEQEW